MRNSIWIALVCSIFIGCNSPKKERVLALTRSIADKIIRETSFDYTVGGLGDNADWSGFEIPCLNDGECYLAHARMHCGSEMKGRVGLAFRGKIAVFLNGKEIYRGKSDSLELSEYTYNRFHIQVILPVDLLEGDNQVLIQCGSEPARVMVLLVNEMDEKDPEVEMIPLVEEPYSSVWLISGPHASENLGDCATDFKNIRDWKVPGQPVIKELVIVDSGSYKRDSYADWHYANGGTMLGILNLFALTQEEKYIDFVSRYAQNVLGNRAYFEWQYRCLHALRGSFHRLFRMCMLDDSGGPVLPFAQLRIMDPEREYDTLLQEVLDYVINRQERLKDGTLCRPEPEPHTIWADDLFMSVPFLCRMAVITGDNRLFDEAAQQVIRFQKYLLDSKTGLYFHGWYDERKEPVPICWGRANGWVCWAMSELLMHLPEDHKDFDRVLEIFRDHVARLATYQDRNGMWHQVLDHPETYEETSCTAMFTLAMARGVRLGWLDESFRRNALKGWSALEDKIGKDGMVTGICRGTGIGESIEYYNARESFEHDPRGLGAMITAGTEICMLLQE